MYKLILFHDKTVAEWVANKIGKPINEPYTALGWIDKTGNLKAGAVFNNWNGSNIDVTIYGPGAVTRRALRAGFRYVFDQLKANRLTAITERSNKTMLKLLPRIGFRNELVLKRWFGPYKRNDGVMFRIEASDAQKWMK